MTDPLLITALSGGVAAVLTAVGGFLHSAGQARKLQIEVRQLHRRVAHETSPNHGSSLRDAVDRNSATLRGMARDLGRLATSNVDQQRHTAEEFGRLHRRVDRIEDATTETTLIHLPLKEG